MDIGQVRGSSPLSSTIFLRKWNDVTEVPKTGTKDLRVYSRSLRIDVALLRIFNPLQKLQRMFIHDIPGNKMGFAAKGGGDLIPYYMFHISR